MSSVEYSASDEYGRQSHYYKLCSGAVSRLIEAHDPHGVEFKRGTKLLTATSSVISLNREEMIGYQGDRKVHFSTCGVTGFEELTVGDTTIEGMITYVPEELIQPQDGIRFINIGLIKRGEDPWIFSGLFTPPRGYNGGLDPELIVKKLQIPTVSQLVPAVSGGASLYRESQPEGVLDILRKSAIRRSVKDDLIV